MSKNFKERYNFEFVGIEQLNMIGFIDMASIQSVKQTDVRRLKITYTVMRTAESGKHYDEVVEDLIETKNEEECRYLMQGI